MRVQRLLALSQPLMRGVTVAYEGLLFGEGDLLKDNEGLEGDRDSRRSQLLFKGEWLESAGGLFAKDTAVLHMLDSIKELQRDIRKAKKKYVEEVLALQEERTMRYIISFERKIILALN